MTNQPARVVDDVFISSDTLIESLGDAYDAGIRHVSEVPVDAQDERYSMAELLVRLKRSGYRLKRMAERRSPSGTGWHLWLWISPSPKSAVETVALQLLLGSDPHREAFCLRRAKAVDGGKVSGFWTRRWNVLYRARTT